MSAATTDIVKPATDQYDNDPPSLFECPTKHMGGISKFLQRVARKHIMGKKFADAQASFSLAYAKELADLEHDPQACVFCLSTHGVCLHFTQDADCQCVGHKECINEMRTNGARQQAQCQSCLARIAEMEKAQEEEEEEEEAEEEEEEEVYVPPPPPSKKRRIVYCGTPIGFSFCHQPRGHLGHCCS